MFDTHYWLWLSLIFETGSPFCDSLLDAFNHNPRSIYEADNVALSPLCKGNEDLLSRLCDKSLDRVNAILDFCQKENVGILTPTSRNFPSSLLKIAASPLVLYYKGRLADFSHSLGIAVVGTRSVTPYGSSAAYTISHDLASTGATVVSGMALGADTAAHRGALDAGGHTVAFLGCGIDIIYPKDNARLMQEIISRGTVMTEYAPGLPPEGRHFPVRNRLISGVSNAVLVIEAAEKSGAMITASHGLKQGKLIYAVPGKVGELSSTGTNLLIRNGAKMVTSANDIISDFSGLYEFRYANKPITGIRAEENLNGLNSPNTGYSQSNTFASTEHSFKNNKPGGAQYGAQKQNAQPQGFSADITNGDVIGSAQYSAQKQNVQPQGYSADITNGAVIGGAQYSAQKQNVQPQGFGVDITNGAVIGGVQYGAQKQNVQQNNNNNVFPHDTKRSTFETFIPRPPQEKLIAAQPRPIVMYNGMTEEEAALSYMSMETESAKSPSPSQLNASFGTFLTYPKEPMPDGGYQIDLSEEKIKSFESNPIATFFTQPLNNTVAVPIIPYNIPNDPFVERAGKKSNKKKRLSFKRVTSDDAIDQAANAKNSKPSDKSDKKSKKSTLDLPPTPKPLSFEGLNETETAVLKFISEKEPVGVDGMNDLGLSVPQLLSTVTMLEIKQKISQRPGGYFEIKK